MKTTYLFTAVACISLAVSTSVATAQGKVTREQAWSQCLKEVNSTTPKSATGEGANDAARTAAFKACMAKLGYPAG